jgi:heme/copper-type cytochrome/quinol oxidase subunit 1
MKRFLSRPDIQLVLIVLCCLAAGAVARHYAVDVHLHDTYYILSLFSLAVIFAFLVMPEAGIYTLTAKFRQWRWLHILHVASLIWVVISFGFYSYFGGSFNTEPGAPRIYYDLGGFNMLRVSGPLFIFTVLVFLAGQVGFLVNIIAGFYRGRKSSTR